MTKKIQQYMVRVTRSDGEWTDVPVDAVDESHAKEIALVIVAAKPDQWFEPLDPPTYAVDPMDDVQELDGTEYRSANA